MYYYNTQLNFCPIFRSSVFEKFSSIFFFFFFFFLLFIYQNFHYVGLCVLSPKTKNTLSTEMLSTNSPTLMVVLQLVKLTIPVSFWSIFWFFWTKKFIGSLLVLPTFFSFFFFTFPVKLWCWIVVVCCQKKKKKQKT